jgi:hypothetical protein
MTSPRKIKAIIDKILQDAEAKDRNAFETGIRQVSVTLDCSDRRARALVGFMKIEPSELCIFYAMNQRLPLVPEIAFLRVHGIETYMFLTRAGVALPKTDAFNNFIHDENIIIKSYTL